MKIVYYLSILFIVLFLGKSFSQEDTVCIKICEGYIVKLYERTEDVATIKTEDFFFFKNKSIFLDGNSTVEDLFVKGKIINMASYVGKYFNLMFHMKADTLQKTSFENKLYFGIFDLPFDSTIRVEGDYFIDIKKAKLFYLEKSIAVKSYIEGQRSSRTQSFLDGNLEYKQKHINMIFPELFLVNY